MISLIMQTVKLLLQRNPSGETATIGTLWVDGVFECHTLEDVVRDKKVYAGTAIPAGSYQVILDYSPRFRRVLPHIQNVPGFTGVRIHPGNTHKDTEGCILPGRWAGGESLVAGTSKPAFDALYKKLQGAKDITIEVRNG